MDWDKLKIFYIVADSGSFTRAAARLNVSQSAVSRNISVLEQRSDVSLFHRHARGFLLTEQGEILYRMVREIFSELSMAQVQITDNKNYARGALSISTTIGFGTTWLAPRLHKFLDHHPDIPITVRVSDVPADLHVNETDVAITSLVTEDKDLIYEELMTRSLYIYSSQKYMDAFGIPKTPRDLDQHRLIVFGDRTMLPSGNVNWLLECGTRKGVSREPYLSVNNLYAIGRLVENGAGISCLPGYVAEKCPGLIRILNQIEGPQVTFYFVYPKPLSGSKRVKAFLDFLRSQAREEEQNA